MKDLAIETHQIHVFCVKIKFGLVCDPQKMPHFGVPYWVATHHWRIAGLEEVRTTKRNAVHYILHGLTLVCAVVNTIKPHVYTQYNSSKQT